MGKYIFLFYRYYMNFRGRIAHHKPGFISRLILPLVLVKKYFELLQSFLIKIIWSELFKGEKVRNPLANLFILLAFCIFSWVFYYLEAYDGLIFIIFVSIWYLDFLLAKYQFMRGNRNKILFTLDTNENSNETSWRMYLPNGEKSQDVFLKEGVRNIFISQHQVKGGCFEEVVGTVWQVGITLDNLRDRTIGEHKQVINAVKKAKSLAKYFDVPIVFESSIGVGKYYAEELDANILSLEFSKPKTLLLKQSPDRSHISTRWRWQESWHLLGEIWQKSGFLLFVLIVSNFMMNFGQVIDEYIKGNAIDLSDILTWFTPKSGLIEIIEFTVAIFFIIFKGWQISRRKHIFVDRDRFKYSLDNKVIGQLNTSEIESILLLKEPITTILILERERSITISNFHSEAESISFLLKISRAVHRFNSESLEK